MIGYLAPFDGSTSMALLTAAAIAKSARDGVSLLLVLCELCRQKCGRVVVVVRLLEEMWYCKSDDWLVDVRCRSEKRRC